MATIGTINLAKGDIYTTAHVYSQNRANDGYGILTGCDAHEKASPGMFVTIDAGTVMYAGSYVVVTGGDLIIDASDATLSRFDIIYVNAAGAIVIAKGADAAILPTGETAFKKMTSPFPAASIPAGVILARVYIGPGITAILNAHIDDIAMTLTQVPLGILTTRGDIPFRGANTWEKLGKGTAGYFLKQGANDPAWAALTPTDPVFTNTARILARKTSGGGAGEECTFSEILDFVGSAIWGASLVRGETGWIKVVKGAAGQVPVQGANVWAWATRPFEAIFAFGDGVSVLVADSFSIPIPIACKITIAEIRSYDATGGPLAGSITCSLYKHSRSGAVGTLVDSFVLATATNIEETGLTIAVAAREWLTVVISGITLCKKITCVLTMEPT